MPGGRLLHEYVNMYFSARNPMMSRIRDKHRELCVLRISSAVLDLDGAIIADQNAARDRVRFARSPEGLERLDNELVFARDWTHPDPAEYDRRKGIRCAEVLVPDRIDPIHIVGAYVSCEVSRRRLVEEAPGLPVTVDADLFFH